MCHSELQYCLESEGRKFNMTRRTNFNEEEKIWSAVYTPTIFNPKNSMGHAILWSLARSPNKLVQVKWFVLMYI